MLIIFKNSLIPAQQIFFFSEEPLLYFLRIKYVHAFLSELIPVHYKTLLNQYFSCNPLIRLRKVDGSNINT